jgi:hypothetical protein
MTDYLKVPKSPRDDHWDNLMLTHREHGKED